MKRDDGIEDTGKPREMEHYFALPQEWQYIGYIVISNDQNGVSFWSTSTQNKEGPGNL